jgi:hypothetical protein
MLTPQEKVSKLVSNLARFYWSPNHPSNYVIKHDGQTRGVGVIAHKDYGAFNLAWGECRGRWKTHADQVNLVTSFSKYQAYTPLPVNNEPLGDWLVLLKARGMQHLLTNDKFINPATKQMLLSAVAGALQVESHDL